MRIIFGLTVLFIGFLALFIFPIGTIVGLFLMYGALKVLRNK